MKIKVNYDLMEKIYESNNGIKLHKILKTNALGTSVALATLVPLDILLSCDGKMVGITLMLSLGITLVQIKMLNRNPILSASSNNELIDLVNQLSNLEVTTTLELLKQSKVIDTNYDVIYEDNKRKIKQQKYIKIKSLFDDEIIMQEHIIGTPVYTLSKSSGKKSLKRRLSSY